MTHIGINYGHIPSKTGTNPEDYDYTLVDRHFALFKSFGIERLSIAMGGWNAAGTYRTQKLALYAKQKGFYVAWGPTGPNVGTPAAWESRNNDYIGAAEWAAANGIDEYHMGNERGINGLRITSLSQSNGLITAITSSPHGYSTGQQVRIGFAALNAYNGTYPITVTGATSFTYTAPGVSASTPSPAHGAHTYVSYRSLVEITADIIASASVVKPYFSGPMLYRASEDEQPSWIASPAVNDGLGAFDRIGFNQYNSESIFAANLRAMVNKWGSKALVTEWSTHGGINSASELDWAFSIKRRAEIIKDLGIETAYFFCAADNGFGVPANVWGIIKTDLVPRLALSALKPRRLWIS